MPIIVACKQCGKNMNAPDTAAGKKGKCAACGAVVEIPAKSTEEPLIALTEVPAVPPPASTHKTGPARAAVMGHGFHKRPRMLTGQMQKPQGSAIVKYGGGCLVFCFAIAVIGTMLMPKQAVLAPEVAVPSPAANIPPPAPAPKPVSPSSNVSGSEARTPGEAPTEAAASANTLPQIVVSKYAASEFTFSNWESSLMFLKGTMTWTGKRGSSKLMYALYDKGTRGRTTH